MSESSGHFFNALLTRTQPTERHQVHPMRNISFAIVLFGLTCAVNGQNPKIVQTVKVIGRPYVQTVHLPGVSVVGYETTRLLAKVGGYVHRLGNIDGVTVDIGTVVTKDAILATIDVPEMDAEVASKKAIVAQANAEVMQTNAAVLEAQALAELRRAQVEQAAARRREKQAVLGLARTKFSRISQLVRSGSIGQENADEAEYELKAAEAMLQSVDADVKTAKANLRSAMASITRAEADVRGAESLVRVAEASLQESLAMASYATIRAPFAGTITRRMIDHGAFVQPATSNSGAMPLFEITQVEKVRILASAPNTVAPLIRTGQSAVLHTIGGLPGVQVDVSVSRLAGVLDAESRMMPIELDVLNPTRDRTTDKPVSLQPGLFGTLTITIREWEALPIVPVTAVATDATGHSYVMKIENGVVRKQRVEVAFNNAKDVGLGNGVRLGESVARSDLKRLQDGQRIRVR